LNLLSKICSEILRKHRGDPDGSTDLRSDRRLVSKLFIIGLRLLPLLALLLGLLTMAQLIADTHERRGSDLTGVGVAIGVSVGATVLGLLSSATLLGLVSGATLPSRMYRPLRIGSSLFSRRPTEVAIDKTRWSFVLLAILSVDATIIIICSLNVVTWLTVRRAEGCLLLLSAPYLLIISTMLGMSRGRRRRGSPEDFLALASGHVVQISIRTLAFVVGTFGARLELRHECASFARGHIPGLTQTDPGCRGPRQPANVSLVERDTARRY